MKIVIVGIGKVGLALTKQLSADNKVTVVDEDDQLVENIINVYNLIDDSYYKVDYELSKDQIEFSLYRGVYIVTTNISRESLVQELYVKGNGNFPYSFGRKYEAIENFQIFKDRQEIINEEIFNFSEYIPYTFGIEFETASGYIPEALCFRDGLIPLRDGSISGIEYSTIVLQGNKGLSLLKQQLKTLRKYTAFNKECSLHVHIGGYPVKPDAIYRAYKLLHYLHDTISELVPPYTFESRRYKENKKDYCKPLPGAPSFDSLYRMLVGRPFFGDLTQGHPNDPLRKAKWNIPTRYYEVNFINMLCYNVNKTIEFRFLRPTYSFNKILIWLLIFNAILVYAETNEEVTSLSNIITYVYPPEIATYVLDGITKLKVLTVNQVNIEDKIGDKIELEEELFG